MSERKSQINNSKFKSTDVKIRAYKFSLTTIAFINTLPNTKTFWTIGDQLLRSSTSIGANIVEGKSSSSRKEFIRYYEIVLKSANETKYWICLLRDSYAELRPTCVKLLNEVEEISKMLGSSIVTLKKKS